MKTTTQMVLILCMFTSVTVFADDSSSSGDMNSHPKRACDAYIQKYCTSGSDKGPGCLKGHESDVSAECLKDMQHKGAPPDKGGSH